ncbi:TMEM175 family protein [Lignipirellula cremea]|uniref:DUF1211 domain-containing protein n=1 Tax=Lignipirellula cremea TaxID=2528010 RepID=A0A518E1J0_9BACT|nr:TMEM175 family protein [Lignipirellula cremea]QDU97933.1 hypothetical protein Pla8534_57920 [Lignipirellula cremea]
MKSSRLEAFSDGVLAIIITIMVLEMKVPQGTDGNALAPMLPVFATYALSFVYVGIYWNNHHHLFQLTERLGGLALWANLHLLFWLSLIPFVTGWMGQNQFAPLPTALYGVVLLFSAIAWKMLQAALVARPHRNVRLQAALGSDLKGLFSIGLYGLGIGLAFVQPWIALVLYLLVAGIWFLPDRRFEKAVEASQRTANEDQGKRSGTT